MFGVIVTYDNLSDKIRYIIFKAHKRLQSIKINDNIIVDNKILFKNIVAKLRMMHRT